MKRFTLNHQTSTNISGAVQKQFRCSLGAVQEQFRSSSITVQEQAVQEQFRINSLVVQEQAVQWQFRSSAGAVQEQFRSSSGAVQEQFRSGSGAVQEKVHFRSRLEAVQDQEQLIKSKTCRSKYSIMKTIIEIVFPKAASEDTST